MLSVCLIPASPNRKSSGSLVYGEYVLFSPFISGELASAKTSTTCPLIAWYHIGNPVAVAVLLIIRFHCYKQVLVQCCV